MTGSCNIRKTRLLNLFNTCKLTDWLILHSLLVLGCRGDSSTALTVWYTNNSPVVKRARWIVPTCLVLWQIEILWILACITCNHPIMSLWAGKVPLIWLWVFRSTLHVERVFANYLSAWCLCWLLRIVAWWEHNSAWIISMISLLTTLLVSSNASSDIEVVRWLISILLLVEITPTQSSPSMSPLRIY